jgi:hypothetical protein
VPEIDSFKASARYAATHQLAGFGKREVTEAVKGTLFPSVVFAAIKLLEVRGRSKIIKKYKGKFDTPNASVSEIIKGQRVALFGY